MKLETTAEEQYVAELIKDKGHYPKLARRMFDERDTLLEVLSWVVERDEALAAAWRALTAEHEALSLESGDYDHLGDAALRAGCDVCQVLERINALEID